MLQNKHCVASENNAKCIEIPAAGDPSMDTDEWNSDPNVIISGRGKQYKS